MRAEPARTLRPRQDPWPVRWGLTAAALLVLGVVKTLERPTGWRWFGCGALLGVVNLVKPTFLVFPVVMALWSNVVLMAVGMCAGAMQLTRMLFAASSTATDRVT